MTVNIRVEIKLLAKDCRMIFQSFKLLHNIYVSIFVLKYLVLGLSGQNKLLHAYLQPAFTLAKHYQQQQTPAPLGQKPRSVRIWIIAVVRCQTPTPLLFHSALSTGQEQKEMFVGSDKELYNRGQLSIKIELGGEKQRQNLKFPPSPPPFPRFSFTSFFLLAVSKQHSRNGKGRAVVCP